MGGEVILEDVKYTEGTEAATLPSFKPGPVPYYFLLPSVFIIAIIVLYPLFYSLFLSFNYLELVGLDRRFVGFENYVYVFTDPRFPATLWRTVFFTFFCLVIQLALGYGLALLFNRPLPFARLLRTLLVMPLLISPVANALFWYLVYDPSIGILQYLFRLGGLGEFKWTTDPTMAIFAVAIVDIWQWTPFVFLVFLAGLQSVPPDVMEAARLDGSKWWKNIFHFQIPLMKFTVVIILLLRFIDLFKSFDLIYILTFGGPGDHTYVLTFLGFIIAFNRLEMGEACAVSFVVLFFVILATIFLVRRLLKTGAKAGEAY